MCGVVARPEGPEVSFFNERLRKKSKKMNGFEDRNLPSPAPQWPTKSRAKLLLGEVCNKHYHRLAGWYALLDALHPLYRKHPHPFLFVHYLVW